LHIDVEDNTVVVRRREEFHDRDHFHKEFNDMGSYEMCHGTELTPPTSAQHCSAGTRPENGGPCMMRLEEMTYDEASEACAARGGRLAHVRTKEDVEALRNFGDNMHLGIGLRDREADDAWKLDGTNEDASVVVADLETEFGRDFRSTGCVQLRRKGDKKGKALFPLECDAKAHWICEGTLNNPEQGEVVATQDLKADEGAFCLWHVHEPVDLLPNDEGRNFANTDLACHLQVSSRSSQRCAYDPEKNKLLRKRGDRENAKNYPVRGETMGWQGNKAKLPFLQLHNHDDRFHCHYSPSNSGLLRVYAMQHMFERSYPGSMKKLCGCGYKHLAQLVSRCDCTRSGHRSNNCATWHKAQLVRATADAHPVRCNNCNKKSNL